MTAPRAAQPVVITLVQAPGCHFCEDAHEAVTQFADRYPIELRPVDIRSEEGGRLVRLHRPALNPLVLVDGEFFSAGRLPRGKLRKLLDRSAGRSPADPAAPAGPAVPSAPRAAAEVG